MKTTSPTLFAPFENGLKVFLCYLKYTSNLNEIFMVTPEEVLNSKSFQNTYSVLTVVKRKNVCMMYRDSS